MKKYVIKLMALFLLIGFVSPQKAFAYIGFDYLNWDYKKWQTI